MHCHRVHVIIFISLLQSVLDDYAVRPKRSAFSKMVTMLL